VFVRLLRMVLQISGIECIVLGFMSWMAALSIQHPKTTDVRAYEEALNFLVTLADLTRALTHTPPYVGLTSLGILLIGLGTALSEYNLRN
jgi:hypothetical protein